MPSSSTPDGLKAEIDAGKMAIGNPVVTSTGAPATASSLPYIDSSSQLARTAVTASKPVYIDSNSVPQTGGFPFGIVVTGVEATQAAVFDITAVTTLSAAEIMHETIVSGAATSLTTTGFLRIKITDTADNLTDGFYYVPFGTLA